MNVIVTGASKGIGAELVKLLAADARVRRVLAVSRDGKRLEALKNEKVVPLVFDLAAAGIDGLVGAVKKEAASVDVLVNNAGGIVNRPFAEISMEELEYVYRVNVFSAFRLTQQLLPLMGKSQRSHVVNISSMGGYMGSAKFAGLSAYSSSKGALSILSECLAEELKEKNIAVNCLCLGAVQTEMLASAFPGYRAPLNPAQMAAFIADFAMNGHRYFNGKVLPVSLSTP
jgi:NAD(P)-dependent dehydrogenase (short-subunit alcohol dehydrogenase family)